MTAQWANANKVISKLPATDITEKHINEALAKLAGKTVTGAVAKSQQLDTLFHYAISTDSRMAWELLCLLYRHTAYTQARAALDDDLADDVAQQVMLQLWTTRAELNPSMNLGGWVRVLAKNAAIDVIRSRRLFETEGVLVEEDEDAFDIDEEGEYGIAQGADVDINYDSPDEILVAQELLAVIEQAYESLPHRTQVVLNMLDGGSTYEEIAETLSTTEDSVRQIAKRGTEYVLEFIAYEKSV